MRDRTPRSIRHRFALQALAFALATAAAQPLTGAPTLTDVKPPGGQRGTAVRLILKGTGLAGQIRMRSEIPGSLAELATEGPSRQFLLEIDPEARPGAYRLAVETASGLTNTWLFSVSAFPETAETESQRRNRPRNDTASVAQAITAPRVVNGTLEQGDRDVYSLDLEAGQRIVFEVEARRLGSAIDPVLAVRTPDGHLAARSDDAPGIGSDSRVDFTAEAPGTHWIEIHDARFSKQMKNFYRLLAGPVEYADAIFPLGWTDGEPVDVELSGGTLDVPRTVRVQGDFAELPGSNAGLPMPFLRSRDREALESKAKKKRRLTEGTVINGRIAQPGEVDSYRLAVREGEEWMLETQAAVLGTSRLYTLLVVRDQDGRKLGSAGDQPPEELLSNISTRAETFGDPALGLSVPDGVTELQVSVEDLLGRGGAGYAYRLVARRQPADFIVRLDDTHVNIPRNGTAGIGLTLDRRGYDGPVRVVAEGLPDGVVAEGGNIPAEFGGMTTQRKSLKGRLMLTAEAGAALGSSPVSFYGEGRTQDGELIRRKVRTSKVVTSVAGEGQRPLRLPGKEGAIEAAVTRPAPATLELISPRELRLIQGLKRDIEWAYRTNEAGVEALSPVNLTNEPSVANLRILGGAKVKPGDSEGSFEMNTTMGTPAMRFDLVLQARVRHEGAEHTIYSPAITVDIVQGYGVGSPDGPVTTERGSEFAISGSFSREPGFDSEVVVDAANLPVGVRCRPHTIADSPAGYTLACRAAPDTEPGTHSVEIAPRSTLAGRDKEAVPYNIPPVEAVLVIAGDDTMAEKQNPAKEP